MRGRGGSGKKWLDFRDILNVELIGFGYGLDAGGWGGGEERS